MAMLNITMVLKETQVKFQLDSGATVNILPVEIYHEAQKDPRLKHLKHEEYTNYSGYV